MLTETLISIFLIGMSLVFHEMGHWVPLRLYNQKIDEFGVGFGPLLVSFGKFKVRMLPWGCYLNPSKDWESGISPKKQLVIVLGGPVANIIYALALYAGANSLESGGPGLKTLADLNILLALFNLFPIPPLDGWGALVAIGKILGHPLEPSTIWLANKVGNGLVYGFGFLLLGLVLIPN